MLRLGPSAGGWGGLVALALSIGLIGVGFAVASGSPTPSVWIDEPLDGTIVPLGMPVAVVGHVADADGLTGARLDINGVQVATSESPVEPGSLATLRFDWVPGAPGVHVLGLWMKPTSAEWIGPALATVFVEGEDETTSTTSTPIATTTPSTTSVPPTTTPCTFGIPEPSSPADNHVFSKTGIAMSVPFTWSYAGCDPDDLVFHIQLANDPSFSGGAVIWTTTTPSQNATSVPITCADYWWRVRVRAPEVGAWSQVYTFIVQDSCSP